MTSATYLAISGLAVGLLACSAPAPLRKTTGPVKVGQSDPDGPHRAAVASAVQPFLDDELVSGLVVGLYDGGKLEVYGFGAGPGGKPPDSHTLFEIGSITKVYTSLLLADALQRREVELDTPVADLLPPGVTAPIRDKTAITLRHLALHTSGLPRVPPSVRTDKPDPYGGYGENALYADLLHTQLDDTPGEKVVYSNYGAGLLGFALGRKLGGSYAKALPERVLSPLGLAETFLVVPPPLEARRASGTDDDLKPVPPWTFDALAGAGALVSSAHDQLALIDAELDAAAGSTAKLRRAMKLTQETQLDHDGDNEGLGWMIDGRGRYWHNGGTGGFHAFIGFDPKTRHGVVLLASTSTSLIDRLADGIYNVLDGTAVPNVEFPTAQQLSSLVGTYDLAGTKLAITAVGKRLYVEGPGEPRHRLIPLSDHEFLLEEIQGIVVFERDIGSFGKVVRMVVVVSGQRVVAPRVPDAPAAAPGAAPAAGAAPAPTP